MLQSWGEDWIEAILAYRRMPGQPHLIHQHSLPSCTTPTETLRNCTIPCITKTNIRHLTPLRASQLQTLEWQLSAYKFITLGLISLNCHILNYLNIFPILYVWLTEYMYVLSLEVGPH